MQRLEGGQKLLPDGHLQHIEMILDAQRRKEIPFDIQVAPEIGIGERKRVASEHGRPDGLRTAEHQGKG